MGLTADSINSKIWELSNSNKVGTDGRRGLYVISARRLVAILFHSTDLSLFLKSQLQDLKAGPRSAIRKSGSDPGQDKMVGGSILDDAKDARRKKKKDIEIVVKGKWCRLRRDWRVDEVKSFHEQSLQYGSAKLLKTNWIGYRKT
jgi:hypothetical protein